jgi:hypothetical protein
MTQIIDGRNIIGLIGDFEVLYFSFHIFQLISHDFELVFILFPLLIHTIFYIFNGNFEGFQLFLPLLLNFGYPGL